MDNDPNAYEEPVQETEEERLAREDRERVDDLIDIGRHEQNEPEPDPYDYE